MRAPLFWDDTRLLSTALLPLSAVYRWLAERRGANIHPEKLPVRVLCVGNLVAGGAGKTPVALAIGSMLKAQGIRAHYLSRGYKGTLKGPVQVDPATHTAREVGDEPLLLAQMLPTWVSKDKVAGGKAAIAAGAQMIILDDGFQNPALHKDVCLLVIDGRHGFGNERLIPAGPLREPIAVGMERATAIIMMGEDTRQLLRYVPAGKPVFHARLEPAPSAFALKDKPVLAFAGIARPRKFYRTLQQLGCEVKKMVAYPDHYDFKPDDLTFLKEKAHALQAVLVTTTKDYARLSDALRMHVVPVPVEVVFADRVSLQKMLS